MAQEQNKQPPWFHHFLKAWQDEQFQQGVIKNADTILRAQFDTRKYKYNYLINENLISSIWPDPGTTTNEEFQQLNATTMDIPESDRDYKRCKESIIRDDVPQGKLFTHNSWPHSVVYPGTVRKIGVYIPNNIKAMDKNVPLMIVPDGFLHVGYMKLPTILDNMIHDNRLPPIVCIFLQAGYSLEEGSEPMEERDLFPPDYAGNLHRYMEFDTLNDSFTRHLLDEIIPFVEKEYELTFTNDPSKRCVAGQSSAALQAFMCCFHRPDKFGLAWVNSLSIGHFGGTILLPYIIRGAEKKKIRVYATAGEFDVEGAMGKWVDHLAIFQDALNFKKYENVCFVGKGAGHSLRYPSSVAAETLEYLFQRKELARPCEVLKISPFVKGIDWHCIVDNNKNNKTDDDKKQQEKKVSLPTWAVNYQNYVYNDQIKSIEKLTTPYFTNIYGIDWPWKKDFQSWLEEDISTIVPDSDRAWERCKEVKKREGVPEGQVFTYDNWQHSVLYPGTLRKIAVYIPHISSDEMRKNEEFALMIVPDGFVHLGYLKFNIVLDNMIHDKRLPPIVCIFLQAGYSLEEGSEPMGPKDMFPQDLAGFCHRFQEMDVMSDRYAGHIINEILPFVTETHNIHISQDPAKRCMCGQSSAAVASLYTCWHRPDKFGLALLTSTSFGNTIPGQLMPYVVRNTPKKNIKMYVHVGEEDAGSYDSLPPNKPCLAPWLLHNQIFRKSLYFQNYDYIFRVGEGGGHSLRFLGAILPEALEYLFMNKDPIVDKSIDFVKPGDYNKIQDVMMAKL